MDKKGTFCISLDFELHWGCFETMKVLDEKGIRHFENTRRAIPEMLKIFADAELHVTWATVGMLYHQDQAAWNAHLPDPVPTFSNDEVSAYAWIAKNGFLSDKDPCHFAPELIDLVKATPFQEIGTHTYAHYFCLEPGQTKAQFEADIRMACKLAAEKGVTIRSLVFPRNQFREEYLTVCREAGITSVRTNPDIWYWSYSKSAGSFMKRFFRAGDAYLKFQPIKTIYLEDIDTTQRPLQLPASRLYRPWRPKYAIENKLKMRRILNEMTKVAQKGAYYHIWWHPENFGAQPDACLDELKRIADHYLLLKDKYGFESLNMGELTERLLNK